MCGQKCETVHLMSSCVQKEKKAQARGQAGEACTLEDDYGTLFRGTETLFRFCTNDKVVNDKVVSAGKFKEGG
jgi:hypothetical protein